MKLLWCQQKEKWGSEKVGMYEEERLFLKLKKNRAGCCAENEMCYTNLSRSLRKQEGKSP